MSAQRKDNRRRVKLVIKQETEFCAHIKADNGARVGRPRGRTGRRAASVSRNVAGR